MHILAGDIGGTKTHLLLCTMEAGGPRVLREQTFPSKRYAGLVPIVREFLDAGDDSVAAAAFGVAGPVRDGISHTTNLPWRIRQTDLAEACGTRRVSLLNDWQVAVLALPDLPDDKLRVLQKGAPSDTGPIAAIGLGTGLGQGILVRTKHGPIPLATEGGHVDFAPTDPVQRALWERVRVEHGRVSVERAVSGSALPNIYRTIVEEGVAPEDPEVTARFEKEDPGAVIGELGVDGQDPACGASVQLLIKMLGAEAGNLALKTLPIGGLYVGGGAAIKLAPLFDHPNFLEAFLSKGRMRTTLESIPVMLVLEPGLGTLGAIAAAKGLLDES